MKIIESAGGPFIGIDLELMHLWSGIEGKSFVGRGSPFLNDYEAAGYLVDGVAKPPCSIAKLRGLITDGLLLSMPLETAVIEADGHSAYIAQVHYADPGWSFSKIARADFDKANFDEHIPFQCKRCTFVFFDAAYPAKEVGDDCIKFDLAESAYILSAALSYPDDETHLILYRITKNSD